MGYYLMSFLAVSILMNYSIKLAPVITWRQGIRHYIVTLFAAVMTSDDAHMAFYSLVHPQYPITLFYVPRGFAPDWLYFLLRGVHMIFGVIIWIESFGSAARKARARTVFLWLWPVFTIVELANYVISVQSYGPLRGIGGFIGFYVFGTALIGFLYSMVYLHFRSSRSDNLFLSQKTV